MADGIAMLGVLVFVGKYALWVFLLEKLWLVEIERLRKANVISDT